MKKRKSNPHPQKTRKRKKEKSMKNKKRKIMDWIHSINLSFSLSQKLLGPLG